MPVRIAFYADEAEFKTSFLLPNGSVDSVLDAKLSARFHIDNAQGDGHSRATATLPLSDMPHLFKGGKTASDVLDVHWVLRAAVKPVCVDTEHTGEEGPASIAWLPHKLAADEPHGYSRVHLTSTDCPENWQLIHHVNADACPDEL